MSAVVVAQFQFIQLYYSVPDTDPRVLLHSLPLTIATTGPERGAYFSWVSLVLPRLNLLLSQLNSASTPEASDEFAFARHTLALLTAFADVGETDRAITLESAQALERQIRSRPEGAT